MSVAGVAHPVERHLAKVEVASSSLVTRSIKDQPDWLVFSFSGRNLIWEKTKFLQLFLEKHFTNCKMYAILHYVLALWCSRLARQPVTLEVDGSSPFGVAK